MEDFKMKKLKFVVTKIANAGFDIGCYDINGSFIDGFNTFNNCTMENISQAITKFFILHTEYENVNYSIEIS